MSAESKTIIGVGLARGRDYSTRTTVLRVRPADVRVEVRVQDQVTGEWTWVGATLADLALRHNLDLPG